jgi:hypothetical protein
LISLAFAKNISFSQNRIQRKAAKVTKGFFCLWSDRERRLDHKTYP